LLVLSRAAAWCDEVAHHAELAEILAGRAYVAQPPELILPALTGRIVARLGEPAITVPDALLFHREAAGFPWRSQALWIYSQLVRWKMIQPSAKAERLAADVFRSDIYRRALGNAGVPMPGASMKLEGALDAPLGVGSHQGALTLGPDRFFDGRVFDPHHVAAYLAELPGR
jgi:NitT/TauT family transport system ATP-binding protein